MKTLAVLLTTVVLLAASACDSESASEGLSPAPSRTQQPDESAPQPDEKSAEVDIYSSVIRRLVVEDHTFGSGRSPFDRVFVIDGPIKNAGDPMNGSAAFGPARRSFSTDVIEGITRELMDLPPIDFIANANEARIGEDGMGGVKGQGVIVSLGPIERVKGKVHVSNMLWCGGLCGQWLAYVLTQTENDWKITGTTGPTAIS